MAHREVTRVEINEVTRRWQLGLSRHQITQGTEVSRPTLRRYLGVAEELGLSVDGPELDEAKLARLAVLSLGRPAPAGCAERGAADALGGADPGLADGRATADDTDRRAAPRARLPGLVQLGVARPPSQPRSPMPTHSPERSNARRRLAYAC